MSTTYDNPNRIDWKTARETIDLASVATNLLGPPPGRRGERGRKLWWSCPFHDDKNPSFAVDPGKTFWKCWGCGQSGDAATLLMRMQGVSFPDAVRQLTGDSLPASKARKPFPTPPTRPPVESPAPVEGMTRIEADALVEQSAAALWSPAGRDALSYLRARCLDDSAIRSATLGFARDVRAVTRDGRTYKASGITIPWYDADQLALLKIRRIDDRRPKYAQVFDDPTALKMFPSPATIKRDRPLFISEGEFDCLLLSRALRPWSSSCVTFGSASNTAREREAERLRFASRLVIALDSDVAGERRAERWRQSHPAALRVSPPPQCKDWTEAAAAGIDLRRYLRDFMNFEVFGNSHLFDWRWGPQLDDDIEGINPMPPIAD